MSQDIKVRIAGYSRFRKGVANPLFMLAGVALVGLMLWELSFSTPQPARSIPASTQPSTQPAEQFAHGAALYNQFCFACHGTTAQGDGPASHVLDPRPRNFRLGRYRLVSSSNGVPFREDVIRSIRNGMPGTSMPAWQQFNDEQLQALADYVLALSKQGLREELIRKKVKPPTIDKVLSIRMTPSKKVEIPPEPAVTHADLLKAKTLYDATCAKCHQEDGSGRQDPEWKTEEGFPIASRNFTSRVYKGGGSAADLFTRIYAGLPGTPMASFSTLSGDDIWRLVHYVQWLGNPKRAPLVATASVANSEGK